MKRMGHDWLSRALGRAGVMPAADAEAAIRAGRVTLNGKPTRQPLTELKARDVVRVDGRRVSLAGRTQVLALHKEAGTVTSRAEDEGPTVFDALGRALPPALRAFTWHAVGRLDRDTTGLLLFTNDEQFVAHATSPDAKVPKHYVARVPSGPTPAQLRALGATSPGPGVVRLTLTEGRFHQVKRLLGDAGLPTLALHREAIGALALDVAPGQVRVVSDDEVKAALGFTPRTFS